MSEPDKQPLRAAVFIDGQNLFRSIKSAFGYYHPNYDPYKLALWSVNAQGWVPAGIHFYTGVPAEKDDWRWNQTWNRMFAAWGRRGVKIYQRPIRYHLETIELPGGGTKTQKVPREKGIDVKIALDLTMQAVHRRYDAAIIFSQDNDLAVAVEEVKSIARDQDRQIPIVSAFPTGASRDFGIAGTRYLRFDKATYDQCIDPKDYRPPNPERR